MKRCRSMAIGVGVLMTSVSCSGAVTPTSPSQVGAFALAEAPGALASTVGSQPVITMLPDLTVTPAIVTVKTGYRVRVVNDSGRYVQIQSYNCSQFQMVDPDPGTWVNTTIFRPAGKVCDYFAWDTNWSRKIFAGRVHVVP